MKRIYDVDVNRAALKKAKSLDEFVKLNPNIFDHLGDTEPLAYAELWEEQKSALASKDAPATLEVPIAKD